MIKKRSGAPPPRRPGAAVRASPAPCRQHSNSLRSRAAAASPDPSARARGRDAGPAAPLLWPRVPCRPTAFLPPRPPRAFFVRCSPPARPTPLLRPPSDSAQGDGLQAEFLETGSEACEPHERAAVRTRRWQPRGGAPGGGPLSGARGAEDAGAGAGEGAGPGRWAEGGRSGRVVGCAHTRQRGPRSASAGPVSGSPLQSAGRSVTKREVSLLFQVLCDLLE